MHTVLLLFDFEIESIKRSNERRRNFSHPITKTAKTTRKNKAKPK